MPLVPGALDVTRPNPARVYDYLLGGTDNFPADREAAYRMLDPETGYPGLRAIAGDNRTFVTKSVTWLAGQGIVQFLDLGCGLPTRPAVHETARAVNPEARVVYVDSDRMVVSHMSAVLRGDQGAGVMEADLTKPRTVLEDGGRWWLLDLRQPVAVILGAVLHFSSSREAARIVKGYASALAPGSAVVVSTARYEDPETAARLAAASVTRWHNHSADDVQGWFDGAGLRLVRGQIADVHTWPLLPSGRPRDAMVLGGIGRRPLLRQGRTGTAISPGSTVIVPSPAAWTTRVTD